MRREGGKLRSAHHRHAAFERLIYPVLGARQISDIKRSDIVRLLDKIEDERGPHMAQVRIPTKPARHSNLKPATRSDLKPAVVPI
jgi:hypothetical protein